MAKSKKVVVKGGKVVNVIVVDDEVELVLEIVEGTVMSAPQDADIGCSVVNGLVVPRPPQPQPPVVESKDRLSALIELLQSKGLISKSEASSL